MSGRKNQDIRTRQVNPIKPQYIPERFGLSGDLLRQERVKRCVVPDLQCGGQCRPLCQSQSGLQGFVRNIVRLVQFPVFLSKGYLAPVVTSLTGFFYIFVEKKSKQKWHKHFVSVKIPLTPFLEQ